ncbi:MAG: zeta toxin family protein [Clostridiales bacterium]|jgi:predicted ABC-type ATPase|nr:zeta toxin family protein [Clostridiales bacterium]
MDSSTRKPIILVFAGPNGSGKTTVTRGIPTFGTYINADDLKAECDLTELEAVQQAELLRNALLDKRADFSFETVLSAERNLLLLEKAKTFGYEVQCIYILTCDENVNAARVRARHTAGSHDVPEDKIRSRYHKALALIPRLLNVCDKIMIYDNSDMPTLIFHKENEKISIFPNELWSETDLRQLLSGTGRWNAN